MWRLTDEWTKMFCRWGRNYYENILDCDKYIIQDNRRRQDE